MPIAYRPYQSEDDYWRMRQFLREIYVLNGQLLPSWHVARLDYSRWHVYLNVDGVRPEDVVFIWEIEEQIVAILLPDGGPGEAHLLVDPRVRTMALEAEMLAVAEANLVASGPDGARELTIWTPETDGERRDLLLKNGYRRGRWLEHQWRRDLDRQIDEVPLATGFEIRSLGDGLELLERCYASGLAFHDGDLNIATENREDPAWYRNIQTAPLYRRDLDLVTIVSGGAVAAFCSIWFDDVTRSAYFEPVGTVPRYQRKGLGRALLTEGLRRLQRMGAKRAFVCGYSPEANGLYRSVMGPEHELYEQWVRDWP